MQLSPGLCSTPLPPPFPADAIPSAAGTSGCQGHQDDTSEEVVLGTSRCDPARQVGKGDAIRRQVSVMQMFPRQRNVQFPPGNAHSRGSLVPPGVLLPAFNSLRNLS